jgi:Signal transduction histidine kinase regulating C4-dicarboxylate transport system
MLSRPTAAVRCSQSRRDGISDSKNKAIDELIVLARSAITENDVSVQTRLAEGLFPIQGDRVQVQQVVLNLVLNAVEAMSSVEAGARELSISTEQTRTNGILLRRCWSQTCWVLRRSTTRWAREILGCKGPKIP